MFPSNLNTENEKRSLGKKLFSLPEFDAVFETMLPTSSLFQQLQHQQVPLQLGISPSSNKSDTDSNVTVKQNAVTKDIHSISRDSPKDEIKESTNEVEEPSVVEPQLSIVRHQDTDIFTANPAIVDDSALVEEVVLFQKRKTRSKK